MRAFGPVHFPCGGVVTRWFFLLALVSLATPAQAEPAPVCDGHTDDTAALEAWWSRLMQTGGPGTLPAGVCVATKPLTWDLSQRRNGIRIQGAGQGQTVLDLRAVKSATPLLITGRSDLFYGHFSDFTVLTDLAAPGVQLGRHDLKDALNGFTFTQIEFKNIARADAAITPEEATHAFLKKVEKLAPFGQDNPKPVFLLRDLALREISRFGKAEEHLKLKIEVNEGNGTIDAVTFFVKGATARVAGTLVSGSRIHLLAHLERDTFSRGNPVRLRLLDIRVV
jgi:hypothetical protein